MQMEISFNREPGDTLVDKQPLTELKYNDNKINLIDCYRVALDFGLPAAQRALENLSVCVPLTDDSSQPALPLFKSGGV